MRTLALDYGSKRIGLAISDVEGEFAFPYGKLDRKNRKHDLAALKQLIEDERVERIVIGIPRHMNGREGTGAQAARDFARELSQLTGFEIDTIDERLTTVEAERVLREMGRKRSKQRDVVDSVAASIILRAYLDMQRAQRDRDEDEG